MTVTVVFFLSLVVGDDGDGDTRRQGPSDQQQQPSQPLQLQFAVPTTDYCTSSTNHNSMRWLDWSGVEWTIYSLATVSFCL